MITNDKEDAATLAFYAGDALTLDDSTITVSDEDAATTIAANTPYLVSGTAGKYTFTGTPTNSANSYTTTVDGVSLTGTLVDMDYSDFSNDGTQYVLQNQSSVLGFYPVTTQSAPTDDDVSTGVTLSAYHCYLTLDSSGSGSGVRAFISLPGTDDDATRIVAVESEEAEADGAIYDLSGRKVSKAVKGVYIQNGKKVLVK